MRIVSFRTRAATAALAVTVALSPLGAAAVLAASDAVDDAYSTPEDTPLTVDAPGLLANDTTDAGTLCVTGYDTSTLEGDLDSASPTDGSFTYTPPDNYNGTTTFTYGVAPVGADGCPVGGTPDDTAVVTITVTAVNDPPTAVADLFTAVKDHTLNVVVPGVLINDSDVDGDPLTAVKVNPAVHGIVTLAADGSFSYTPADGYVGPDAFSYKASDGTAQSKTRVVSINVVAVPPPPTPTPAPTPTPEPPTPSPEPSPSDTPAPTDSGRATLPAESASPSPSPTAGPTPVVPTGGGLPLPALLALGLLVVLLGVAGLYFVRSQRGGEAVADTGAYPVDDAGYDDDFVDHTPQR
jgi:hypothetical protein